jgi:hypothetical protein|tara:strand:- start:4636 stop:5010 length:375 start_codon:yes stop_codon:yes gene_type:complete
MKNTKEKSLDELIDYFDRSYKSKLEMLTFFIIASIIICVIVFTLFSLMPSTEYRFHSDSVMRAKGIRHLGGSCYMCGSSYKRHLLFENSKSGYCRFDFGKHKSWWFDLRWIMKDYYLICKKCKK